MIDTGADWHTHSSVSDGADPLEVMALAGAAAGLHTLGLSDHVRRDTTWLPDYVRSVRALTVPGLRISCGVEVKVLDLAGTLDLPARLPDLDHVLVADHQMPGADGPVHPDTVRALLAAGGTTPEVVLQELLTATAAAVRRAPARPILAHLFSILPKVGLHEDEVTLELLDELALACRETGAAVEVNEKWRCPSPRVVHRLQEQGVLVTAGSDAHRAVDVGVWSYVDEVGDAS